MQTKKQDFCIRNFEVAYVSLWGKYALDIYRLAKILSWATNNKLGEGCIVAKDIALAWVEERKKAVGLTKSQEKLKEICEQTTTDDICFYVE